MSEKRKFDICRDYKATGNTAIDAVASCIMWHRQRKISLKAIHLQLYWYEKFKKGTEEMLGRSLNEGELMSMDSVNIEKGSLFQPRPFSPETFNDFNRNLGINTDKIKPN